MTASSITRAERAREAVVDGLRSETCISLPVPVLWDGTWADAFFTFSISTVGMVPYPATDCRIVTGNGSVAIEPNAFALQLQPYDLSRDKPLANWEDSYRKAYDNYDAAFDELKSGSPGVACEAYVRAVRLATLPSQMAYYEAMNPLLFSLQ